MKKSSWIFNPFTLVLIFGVSLFITHKIMSKNKSDRELRENTEELNDLKIGRERFMDSANYQIELDKLVEKNK